MQESGSSAGYKSRFLETLGKVAISISLVSSCGCGGLYIQKTYDSSGKVRAEHISIFGNGSDQRVEGDRTINDAKQQYVPGFGSGYPTVYGGYYSPGTGQYWYPPTATPQFGPTFIGPGMNGGTHWRINEKFDKEKPRDFALTGLEDLPPSEYHVIADLVEKHRINQKPKSTI